MHINDVYLLEKDYLMQQRNKNRKVGCKNEI